MGSIKHSRSCETQIYVYVFSHTQITLLQMFVTRKLMLTCIWGRKFFTDYKYSPKSELWVIEKIVTHCYYWSAENALTDGPSLPVFIGQQLSKTGYPVHCHRQQSTVQRVSTHSTTVSPFAITASFYCLRAVLYRQTYDTTSLRTVVVIRYHYSVQNYHYSLRNNPEERNSHLLRGGSL